MEVISLSKLLSLQTRVSSRSLDAAAAGAHQNVPPPLVHAQPLPEAQPDDVLPQPSFVNSIDGLEGEERLCVLRPPLPGVLALVRGHAFGPELGDHTPADLVDRLDSRYRNEVVRLWVMQRTCMASTRSGVCEAVAGTKWERTEEDLRPLAPLFGPSLGDVDE